MTILDIGDLNDEQRRRLTLVASGAGGTFFFLLVSGALAGSQALIADGLDFAALAVALGLGLALKDAPAALRAGARLVGNVVLALTGLAVGLATLPGFVARVAPEPTLMGAAALVALAANGTTLYLLRDEREEGAPRNLWFTARTDLVGSAAALIAAGVVLLVGNAVPDLTVAGVIVVLFFVMLVPELRGAMAQWESQRTGAAAPTPPGDPEAH